MRIAILGNNDAPLRLGKLALQNGFTLIGIGYQKKPETKQQKAIERQFAEIAVRYNLNDQKATEWLQTLKVDLVINAFCNFKFKRILKAFTPHVINIHLAPLPKYRGRHPMHWALINGEQKYGYTIHEMRDGFDGGPILHQNLITVAPLSSVQELRTQLMQQLEANWPEFLTKYVNREIEPIKNSDDEATYVARRFPEDSRITEWDNPELIIRKAHALKSEPNPAYFLLTKGDQKIDVLQAHLGERNFVGFAQPMIVGKKGNHCEIVCNTGQTIVFQLADHNSESISVNQKIKGR
jgi:methionyl-tRNA formyltransferase